MSSSNNLTKQYEYYQKNNLGLKYIKSFWKYIVPLTKFKKKCVKNYIDITKKSYLVESS